MTKNNNPTRSSVESEGAPDVPSPIQGQLLRLSEHHTVAIYLRHGSTWVADFIDGRGILVDVNTWFRFNCGTLANSQALRRMALESAIPLSVELVERIEALHRGAAPRESALVRWVEAIAAVLPLGRLVTVVACQFHRRGSK